ncbi:GCN5-related N-acetyltransferase domain protein [Methylocaldum marinum]|uniref:GCN5-related N-acetyltransferase domain protein n=2 Tax=Methylocaldum marinum TaxID=1432792 RepID=A0A286T5K8_9GAMM|nr:GCN5-related N-acetyltransferase domain protein [Methylocaldum marinum]
MEIREKTNTDDVAEVVTLATEDLRRVYRRAPTIDGFSSLDAEQEVVSLVAVERSVIVGVVEYCREADSLYIRGLAVHPQKRRSGVGKALVREVEAIATREGKPKVTLSTIKETGNPRIFERLGYCSFNEVTATGFESLDGKPVTKVDMVRMLA